MLSLFTTYTINGRTDFIYDYAFVAIPTLILQRGQGQVESLNLFEYIHWGLLLFAHIGMAILPFLYFKFESRKILIFLPLSFLILQFFVLAIFEFILIPFAIVWFIVLYLSKKIIEDKSLV